MFHVRLQNNPHFCVFKYARAVKQKVERGWTYGRVRLARFARLRLLRHASPISLLILRKKPTVLQSNSTYGWFCLSLQWNHPPFPVTEPSTYNRSQISQSPSKWNVLFQNRIIAPMIAKPFPSMSQHTKMLQKSRDPSGHFRLSDDL